MTNDSITVPTNSFFCPLACITITQPFLSTTCGSSLLISIMAAGLGPALCHDAAQRRRCTKRKKNCMCVFFCFFFLACIPASAMPFRVSCTHGRVQACAGAFAACLISYYPYTPLRRLKMMHHLRQGSGTREMCR